MLISHKYMHIAGELQPFKINLFVGHQPISLKLTFTENGFGEYLPNASAFPLKWHPGHIDQNLMAWLYTIGILGKLHLCETAPHVPIRKCLVGLGQFLRNLQLIFLEVKYCFRGKGTSFLVKVYFSEMGV